MVRTFIIHTWTYASWFETTSKVPIQAISKTNNMQLKLKTNQKEQNRTRFLERNQKEKKRISCNLQYIKQTKNIALTITNLAPSIHLPNFEGLSILTKYQCL
jgi:2-phosphoglycerate kinase